MTSLTYLGASITPLAAQVVVVVVGFFLTLWLLKWMFWGPVLKVLDERRETITREFDDIEKKQERLNSQIHDYQERLRHIQDEAREAMNKEIERGKKAAAEIEESARHQAEDIRKKAALDIQLEIEKARVELRNEMVQLTIEATEKLLRAELNDERHRELVGSFIAEVERRKE